MRKAVPAGSAVRADGSSIFRPDDAYDIVDDASQESSGGRSAFIGCRKVKSPLSLTLWAPSTPNSHLVISNAKHKAACCHR